MSSVQAQTVVPGDLVLQGLPPSGCATLGVTRPLCAPVSSGVTYVRTEHRAGCLSLGLSQGWLSQSWHPGFKPCLGLYTQHRGAGSLPACPGTGTHVSPF